MKRESPFARALWRIYRRLERPDPWQKDGTLPWNEPEFSRRMLREHLDESHAAASRNTKERQIQITWLWERLDLSPGKRVLDLACGPGLYAVELARRGCHVTGVDYSPASIAHAQELAHRYQVSERCTFVECDVRDLNFVKEEFDAALFLYGQLAVFPKEEARELLRQSANGMGPGGRLLVELLDQDRVDKEVDSWWFSDDSGLWGDSPYIHLGERFWLEEEKISIDRFSIIHLESGQLDEIILCDQTYSVKEMVQIMEEAGFSNVDTYTAWDGLTLYDADEWTVYLAQTPYD